MGQNLRCSPGQGNPGSVCEQAAKEEAMLLLANFWGLAWSSLHFQVTSPTSHIVAGTPPAAVLVVVPRVGGFVYVLGYPEKLAVSSTAPIPTGFTGRVMRLYFPSAGALGCMFWPGAGFTGSQGISPRFLSTIHECRAACSTDCCHHTESSLLLLRVWMNIALNPWL